MSIMSQESSATLHLVRVSAFNNDALAQCINSLVINDVIVLLDDGCYNHNHPLLTALSEQKPKVKVFMIAKHARARAIDIAPTQKNTSSDSDQNNIDNVNINLITMTELVKLTFLHQRSITWQC